jgi:hypothetical protein
MNSLYYNQFTQELAQFFSGIGLGPEGFSNIYALPQGKHHFCTELGFWSLSSSVGIALQERVGLGNQGRA